MRTNHYRAISHWFRWEDLDFPNPAVEKSICDKVKAAAEAKVELAVVFGFHFRWDFIYNFDLVHKVLKFAVDEYHKYGIKVIDHHSAVLTYRPRSWQERQDNFVMDHHHVPMTPDPAIIGDLHYAGKRLNDLRQLRVDDNTPVYIPNYHSEVFCVNNPDFRYAYNAYIHRLFTETGINGLMCDDVCHYGRWTSCGCEHCRRKFRMITGKTLPPATDFNFWGNYSNPDFRAWVNIHLTDGRDFLQMVKENIPADALLTSCCSSSTPRPNDCYGLDLSVWNPALNTIMLEMGGDTSDAEIIPFRAPDILLNCSIAERRNLPCLGLGYSFFPDEGFSAWSLNKFFNSDMWISSHKTRCGLTTQEQNALPDEPEIVHEAYNFDAAHPELAELDDISQIAVYFSSASRNFNGKSAQDYSTGVRAVIGALFGSNATFNVTHILPEDASKIKCLILSDADCISESERKALDNFTADGGKLIVTGLLGGRDETGADHPAGSYLKKFGIEPIRPECDPILDEETQKEFFSNSFGEIKGTSPCLLEFKAEKALGDADKYRFYKIAENIYWSPLRAHAEKRAEEIAQFALELTEMPLKIESSEQLRYRMYKAKDGDLVIHILPMNAKAKKHDTLRLRGRYPIVESVSYRPLSGTVTVSGNVKSGTLYSADLNKSVDFEAENGKLSVKLDGLERFFSIKVKIDS